MWKFMLFSIFFQLIGFTFLAGIEPIPAVLYWESDGRLYIEAMGHRYRIEVLTHDLESCKCLDQMVSCMPNK